MSSNGSARVGAGGIEGILVCFADVIRRSLDSADTHSLAFSTLLKIIQSNQHQLSKFLVELNGLKLVEFILVHKNCLITEHLLHHYLDFCLIRKGQYFLIKSSILVHHLMSCWRAWHKDLQVAKSLYGRLIRLIQPSESSIRMQAEERKLEDCYADHNFKMMTEAGGIDILMNTIRECLVPLDISAAKINHELIEIIVNLISLLIKHPPSLDVIMDIMDLLMFLHPDTKAYVDAIADKTTFLYELKSVEESPTYFENVSRSRNIESPISETLSNYQISCENIGRDLESERRLEERDAIHKNIAKNSSNDDIFCDTEHYVEIDKNRSVDNSNIINRSYKMTTRRNAKWPGDSAWIYDEIYFCNDSYIDLSHRDHNGLKCSNRNFAIASIADMLTSIVKLSLTDPMKILTEAFQKQIIDIRKLIILANNNCPLVRERALCLFLHCIRACYNFDLRNILSKYEYVIEGSTVELYIPIQLIARQLLKYPVTKKMVQLCYGIIIGINDFETAKEVCLTFDIDTMNNGLQLNIMLLLVQLVPKLKVSADKISYIKFLRAYIKKLMSLNEDDSLRVLITTNLIESLMQIYFTRLEESIARSADENCRLSQNEDALQYPFAHDELQDELDETLIMIVRYFIQNLSTPETIKSIDNILTYLDLLNIHVPTDFKSVMRDRKVLVLITAIRYMQQYEETARQKNYGGKIEYYLKNLFKTDNSKIFVNIMPESRFELMSMLYGTTLDDYVQRPTSKTGNGKSASRVDLNIQAQSLSTILDEHAIIPGDEFFTMDESCGTNNPSEFRKIDVSNVIERFQSTIRFVVEFVISREPHVIPSPLERRFTISCIKMLSCYIDDLISLPLRDAHRNRLWSLILSKLDRLLRISFSRLVLYLLSPCESNNLDERKYFAAKLLDLFDADHLLELLDDKSDRITYKVFVMFIRDLIDSDSLQDSSDSSNYEQGSEILCEETEDQLRLIARRIEQILAIKFKSYSDRKQKFVSKISNGFSHQLDANFLDIWMSDIKQIAEELCDKVMSFKNGLQMQDGLGNVYLNDSGTNKLFNESLQITRDAVDDKHEQRKAYLSDLKQNKMYNYSVRQQWLALIIGHTHERALWFLDSHHPVSWELNPVEGPSRIRRRLRSCKLMLEQRYIRNSRIEMMPNQQTSRLMKSLDDTRDNIMKDDWHNIYSPHPLWSMIINHEQSMNSNELRARLFTTDKIHFNCDCSIVRPNEVCDGEISIASWCIHFIGERNNNYQQNLINHSTLDRLHSRLHHEDAEFSGSKIISKSRMQVNPCSISQQNTSCLTIVEDLWFDEIVEIWDRRYQLQDVGLEIFLTNNMTYLLKFRNNPDREDFKQNLMREHSKLLNFHRFNENTSLDRMTQFWRQGILTNFDFLTYLNKLAGRSFNDLMQYPVFPFVLSNYTTPILDLNLSTNFRDLKKPMAVQNSDREATFINNYKNSQSTNLTEGLCGMRQPYHYGNHYSNSATVLHFLVRLPPFTQMHVQYQDNNFDQPDRIFHSIANTWQLITRDSNTDFKELIPEFFFLPEMFINFEHFDLGVKQNNEIVDDVKLPPWCPNSDARLFTLIHRQALESRYVTENLNHWIDLIFGFKQTGKAAVEALNVFHPATYYGIISGLIGRQTSSASACSTTQISATIADISSKSSMYSSDYISTTDLNNANHSTGGLHSKNEIETIKRRNLTTTHQMDRQQADIELLALETMIKTYGQMPRQLYAQPVKSRREKGSASFPKLKQTIDGANYRERIEPLKHVRGLRWGSYVGSPDENDITVIRHKKIISNELSMKEKNGSPAASRTNIVGDATQYYFCLLPNGEIAILQENTSLMLNCSADRKSHDDGYPTYPKYIKRIGLRSVARMNLFSNMIISRQQFNHIMSENSGIGNLETASASSPSSIMSLHVRMNDFSPKSLSLVRWSYPDGMIRVRQRAQFSQRPFTPLIQADNAIDQMTTCISVPELNLLLIGHKSGAICAHIFSTSQKIVPTAQYEETSADSITTEQASRSAAPSAVHFLHINSDHTSAVETNESFSTISFAGKALQSVPSLNKTTRWLYCHEKRINCMRININFGVVVTGSDDGTSVIWDLNSLTYVRTIDYQLQKSIGKCEKSFKDKKKSDIKNLVSSNNSVLKNSQISDYLCNCDKSPYLNTQKIKLGKVHYINNLNCQDSQQSCICSNGISLISISDTLGDIVSIKNISNRIARTCSTDGSQNSMYSSKSSMNCAGISMRGNVNGEDNENMSSILYCHTINGSLVGYVNCQSRVTAVCYSGAAEGLSVNVIVTGLADGLIRLYSSWDLSRVREFHVFGLNSPITSLLYSRDNQLLYVSYRDSQMVVLRNKKDNSVTIPREWIL